MNRFLFSFLLFLSVGSATADGFTDFDRQSQWAEQARQEQSRQNAEMGRARMDLDRLTSRRDRAFSNLVVILERLKDQ